MDNLSFGQALEFAKCGGRIARRGWNGKNMFVFVRPEAEIRIDRVCKLESLPQSVRDFYKQDLIDGDGVEITNVSDTDTVKFTPYLCMKAADGTVVNGWLASQTDMLSYDWISLDSSKD